MLNSRATLTVMLAVSFVMAACSPERDPQSLYAPAGVGELVVDMVLIVDEPLPELILSRTQPPGAPFIPSEAAVADAVVTVTSGAGVVYSYFWRSEGYYIAVDRWSSVLPEMKYDLLVTTPEGEVVTATTTTPPSFAVDSWVLLATTPGETDRQLRTFAELGSDVYYAPENQLYYAEGILEARFETAPTAGYQLALFSLDYWSDFVIDPPFLDDEDLAEIDREGSSPVFDADDGRVRLPWFAIYFEGRHRYLIYAVDNNWYDLLRTSETGGGLGFGGSVGDGVERPIFHVEGGIGLFGSASSDSVGFYVNPAR